MKSTTIAAISTPFGNGGIGIIRLSGNRSVNIATSLFQRTHKREKSGVTRQEELFVSHRFYHGKMNDLQRYTEFRRFHKKSFHKTQLYWWNQSNIYWIHDFCQYNYLFLGHESALIISAPFVECFVYIFLITIVAGWGLIKDKEIAIKKGKINK